MRHLAYTLFILLLVGCSSGGSSSVESVTNGQSIKTKTLEFESSPGVYMAVNTPDGWTRVPEGRVVTLEVSETYFDLLEACPSSKHVHISRLSTSDLSGKKMGFCISTDESFLELFSRIKKILPPGSSKDDLNGVYFKLLTSQGKSFQTISELLRKEGSNTGRLVWEENTLSDEHFSAVPALDFTDASSQNIADFTEQYSVSVTFSTSEIKNQLSESPQVVSFTLQNNTDSIPFSIRKFSPYQIDVPKVLIEGKPATRKTSLDIIWETKRNHFGSSVKIRQYEEMDLSLNSSLQFGFEKMPYLPTAHQYRFELDSKRVLVPSYIPGIVGQTLESIEYGFKTVNGQNETKWTFVDRSRTSLDGEIEVLIPDGAQLEGFPGELSTLRRTGFSFKNSQVIYRFSSEIKEGATQMSFESRTAVLNNQ